MTEQWRWPGAGRLAAAWTRTRHAVVLSVVAAFGAFMVACGNDAQDAEETAKPSEPRSVSLAHFPAFATNSGFYVAEDRGYFDEVGIDLQIDTIPGGAEIAASVAAGRTDFGVVPAVEAVQARHGGASVVVVAALQRHSPIATASLQTTGISSPSDYAGKSFGGEGIEFDLLPVLARRNGFDAASVERIQMQYDVLFPSLMSGEVDFIGAFYSSRAYEWGEAARTNGKPIDFLLWSDYGLDLYGDVLITPERLIKEDPDLVRDFLRGMARGFAHAIENPDAMPEIVRKTQPDEDPVNLRESWRRNMELMEGSGFNHLGFGWIDPDAFRATINTLIEGGVIPGPDTAPALQGAFSNDFLPGITVQLPKGE